MSPRPSIVSLLLVLPLAGCGAASGSLPQAAAAARSDTSWQVERGIVYTPAAWPVALSADLYRPGGQQPSPAIVTVHGGGWDARDRSDMDGVARKLARRGYAVLNIDYRLAPGALHPAQLDDLRQAIAWLRRNAARLNVDPDRIGGWGYSAGGHLVALAATDRGNPATRLDAVVAGGTPTDLPHYPKSPIITRFIGKTYEQDPQGWRGASPIAHVDSQAPPMFLYHGTWDRLVEVGDTVRLHDALAAAGVRSELYLVHGAGHIATFLFGFGAEGAGIAFLDSVLHPAGAAA